MKFKVFNKRALFLVLMAFSGFHLACSGKSATNSTDTGTTTGTNTGNQNTTGLSPSPTFTPSNIVYQPGTPMVIGWDTSSSTPSNYIVTACQGNSCWEWERVVCSGNNCKVIDAYGNDKNDVFLQLSQNSNKGISYHLSDSSYSTLGTGYAPSIAHIE